jgi:hypothetical protein
MISTEHGEQGNVSKAATVSPALLSISSKAGANPGGCDRPPGTSDAATETAPTEASRANRRRKTCTGCGKTKSLTSFYCHPTGKGGRGSKCKLCTREMVNANRELKGDVYREKSREREQRPERIAYKRAYHRRYVKTARGRESRRITQRAYRATRRAASAPRFPSDLPAAIAGRRARSEQQRQAAG